MTRTHHWGMALIPAVALAVSACGVIGGAGAATSPATATGNSPATSSLPPRAAAAGDAPITLRLAIADSDDSPSRPAVDDLIQKVATLSDGKITVVPTFDAGGSTFEEGTADVVIKGDADLALVASRVWDLRGETSLRALQAPFLVDNDALLRALASGPIGREALDGLTGVVGLSMWPEDLRHLLTIPACGHDFRTPAGLTGATILMSPSGVSHRILEVLGATRYQFYESDRNVDAEACRLHGLEGGMLKLRANAMDAKPALTADIVAFGKLQTLVANQAAFDRLSDAQRSVLQEAADAVAVAALDRDPTDAELAGAWCDAGGSIVLAGSSAQAAFRDATQPIYDELEQDAITKRLIGEIEALKAATPAAPGAQPCAAAAQPTAIPIDAIDTTGYVGTTFPNGTFRRDLVPEDLIKAGLDPVIAEANEQRLTYVFDHGKATFRWESKGSSGSCEGKYESVDGDYVRMTTTSGDATCGVGPNNVWREEPDGGISFITLDPTFLPSDHLMLDHWVWTRIK